MSLAKKCDICGKLYEMYGFCTNEPDYNTFTLDKRNNDNMIVFGSSKTYDCCPKCMSNILRTIGEVKKDG